ncbi:indole-3-glycerol phosphate synthase TrpC [Pelosinus sp. IPA-1]|uniref:indole-3-glycerol phosphate synthase TrpC n=1 Tax=Pelosinus sp. IPA-1 TaxID=3029569 RepID=UPI00243627D2|nr:indole-3-glycerol phosphate synthase TrpC [Pelosinus sp. IPA-1]GMB00741.1 indole-3-glycerol-phosphate synthase [Pelosinus sp. IPA-1]
MLNQIVMKKRLEVEGRKEQQPLSSFRDSIEKGCFSFYKAIREAPWALIAECKLASPVKGQLCTNYTETQLAELYTANGATALSVHTDLHFNGELENIAAVRAVTSLPILRKDFIIDVYQVYESRLVGADAILLIAAVLTDAEIEEYLGVAKEIGLDCLVEVHTLEELLRVQKTSANLVGINNRDLKTFKTDISNTFSLLPHCSSDVLLISESGIKTGEDARRLEQAGVKGILVGEGLVRAQDISGMTQEMALRK